MKDPVPACRRIFTLTSATVLTLSLAQLAQDPFRATNEQGIGDSRFPSHLQRETTCRALSATSGIEVSQRSVAYAMKASAYTNKDLNSFNSYGQKTLAAARLM